MSPETFSTQDLPRRQQYDAWRGWFGSVFEVAPPGSRDDGFLAKSEVWTLNGFAVSRVSAPPIKVVRSQALIRREPIDHWAITIGRRAATRFGSHDAITEASAGTPFIVSLGHEVVSERDDDERLQLYLQRDQQHDLASTLDAACGTALRTPMGRVLADYLTVLERNLPNLPKEDASRLGGAVAAMVAACVSPSPDRMALAARQVDCGRLERVRRAVRRYLRAPALGPGFLCRAVGTSRSQLYRLMEPEGGVSRYIQRQRLLESHAMLCDPANAKPIVVIAQELCFADASGFSRAFRNEFGVTPGDARTAARAGFPPPPQRVHRRDGAPSSFSDSLRAA